MFCQRLLDPLSDAVAPIKPIDAMLGIASPHLSPRGHKGDRTSAKPARTPATTALTTDSYWWGGAWRGLLNLYATRPFSSDELCRLPRKPRNHPMVSWHRIPPDQREMRCQRSHVRLSRHIWKRPKERGSSGKQKRRLVRGRAACPNIPCDALQVTFICMQIQKETRSWKINLFFVFRCDYSWHLFITYKLENQSNPSQIYTNSKSANLT